MRDFGLPPATDNTQRRQDVVIELLSDILDELRGAVPGVNAAAVIPGVTPETTDLTEPRRPARKRSNG